jgi:hypothetical protein
MTHAHQRSLACVAPALTADTFPIPKGAGHVALLAMFRSVRQIAGVIERIVLDSSFRSQLRKDVLAQATAFRWTAKPARIQELINLGLGMGVASCQR